MLNNIFPPGLKNPFHSIEPTRKDSFLYCSRLKGIGTGSDLSMGKSHTVQIIEHS